MESIAMTDRNNLFGSLEFAMEAAKKGIKPIHGAILNLNFQGEVAEILLLAKDQIGYKNLLRLVSHIYTKSDRNNNLEISFEDLKSSPRRLDNFIELYQGII
jgi:DNA polymerase-3 subunit alpha